MSDPHRLHEIRCPVHRFVTINDWERVGRQDGRLFVPLLSTLSVSVNILLLGFVQSDWVAIATTARGVESGGQDVH